MAIRQAMIYGSVLASFSVEGIGLERLRDLTREDIVGRFRAFHQLTQFDHIDL
jgi:hypothetical protein